MDGSVIVKYGVNVLNKPDFVGMTVSQIRDEVTDVLNIPDEAQVRVNNVAASPDHEVSAGSTVEFVKQAGEKG